MLMNYLISAVDGLLMNYLLSVDGDVDELPAISSRWVLMNYLLSAVDGAVDEQPNISSRWSC